MIADSQKIEFPCPNCRQDAIKSVHWIRTYATLTCASCKTVINLQQEQLLEAISKAS